jgi:hypothetical protein
MGLLEIKKVALVSPLMAFLNAAQWLDVVARLHAGQVRGKKPPDGASAWRGFFKAYLPQYQGQGEKLYQEYRCRMSHQFAIEGFRLTEHHPEHHWSLDGDIRLLHLDTFLKDLDAAYKSFRADLERDAALRRRVLERMRALPPIRIVQHHPQAPVATSWASAIAASGTN